MQHSAARSALAVGLRSTSCIRSSRRPRRPAETVAAWTEREPHVARGDSSGTPDARPHSNRPGPATVPPICCCAGRAQMPPPYGVEAARGGAERVHTKPMRAAAQAERLRIARVDQFYEPRQVGLHAVDRAGFEIDPAALGLDRPSTSARVGRQFVTAEHVPALTVRSMPRGEACPTAPGYQPGEFSKRTPSVSALELPSGLASISAGARKCDDPRWRVQR